ncbi:imidazole glycerol phosphate synthase subunit HisH [soil metagenome]
MSGAIAILDYGIGNLASVEKAFAAVGARATLVRDPAEVARSRAIVLPGVGNFGHCSRAFFGSGLAEPAREAIAAGVPLLGICVGMQLLFERSEEDGAAPGLGVIPGVVRLMRDAPRVPQTGWNTVDLVGAHPWLEGLRSGRHFYFVHSYAPETSAEVVLGTVDYGGPRIAIVGSARVLGVQFHPEKSGADGLGLLSSFAHAA